MQLPDLPEEDQEPKPKSEEISKAGGQSKQKPEEFVHREMISHRPGDTGKVPDPMAKEKPASRPVTRSLSEDAPLYEPHETNISPNSIHQNDSQPTHRFPSFDKRVALPSGKVKNPGRRLHAFEAAAKNARPAMVPWRYRLLPTREKTHRAYWDVAATFSLIVNAVLVGILLIMAGQVRNLRTTVNSLLGGLYGNIVKMDQASINTTILVNAQIPLDFNLPVSQNTEVVLTRDVSIPDAHIVINTGVLNINARANITIPAGTSMPIALNLEIPVQSTIPISLQVPVNIPINQTELHEPFTGLQTNLSQLYCTLNKNAQYPEGIYICAEHDAPTPGTP